MFKKFLLFWSLLLLTSSLALADDTTNSSMSYVFDGSEVVMSPHNYGTDAFMNLVPSQNKVTASLTHDGLNSVWQLLAVEGQENVYCLYNKNSAVYLGKTTSNSVVVPTVTDKDSAGKYLVAADDGGVHFQDTENTGQYLNCAALSIYDKSLVSWYTPGDNSSFYLRPVPDSFLNTVTGTDLLLRPYNKHGDFMDCDVVNNIIVPSEDVGLTSVWRLVSAPVSDLENVSTAYYLFNSYYNVYLGKISSTAKTVNGSQGIALVTSTDDAGRYLIEVAGADSKCISLKDLDSTNSNNYLSCDPTATGSVLTSDALMNGDEWITNSLFYLETTTGVELPTATISLLKDKAELFISPYNIYNDSSNSQGYVNIDDPSGNMFGSLSFESWNSTWRFVAVTETDGETTTTVPNTYYLMNPITQMYLGKTSSTTGTKLELVSDVADAGKYKVTIDNLTGEGVLIYDTEATGNYGYLCCDATAANTEPLVNASDIADNKGCIFYFSQAERVSYNYVEDGSKIEIRPYLASTRYMTLHSGLSYTWATENRSGLNSVWTLKATSEEGVYYLYNEAQGIYIGKTTDGKGGSQPVPMTTNIDEAGRYKILQDLAFPSSVTFENIDTDYDYRYLNCNSNTDWDGKKLVNWVLAGYNRLFYLIGDKESTMASTELVGDGSEINLNPYKYYNQGLDGYVNVNSDATGIVGSDTSAQWNSIWKLVAVEGQEGVYYLYNEKTGKYIGKTDTSASGTALTLTDNQSEAGRYRITADPSTGYAIQLRDIDNSTDNYAYLFLHSSGVIVNGTPSDYNSYFFLARSEGVALPDDLIKWYEANIGDGIGDFKKENIEPLIDALKANPDDYNAYEALLQARENEDNYYLPLEGHIYQIESAFEYYEGLYLNETYLERYWHIRQNRQRVYFQISDYENGVVSSYWKFDKQDKKNGTDGENYYYMRTLNSNYVLRATSNNTVVDVRPDSDPEAGLFSIIKNDLVTIPHSVVLKSHYNNDERSWAEGHSLLGLWILPYDNEYGFKGDASIRDGAEVPLKDTFYPLSGNANLWKIIPVDSVPIYFSKIEDSEKTTDGKYYNAYCFPFAVKVPDDLKAYCAGYNLFDNGGFIDLVAYDDNIVPANSPVIIVSQSEGSYKLPILYDYVTPEDYSLSVFGLEGNIMPKALDENEVVYIIDDDGDNFANKIVENEDWSYDPTDLHTGSSNYPMDSLHDYQDSSYVISINKAVVKIKTSATSDDDDNTLPDTIEIRVNPNITVGVDTINDETGREPERDANGNLIYYDLCGRRVTNPAPGFYILTNGKKVLIK
jgi:hypothetical protein